MSGLQPQPDEARNGAMDELADQFCQASIRDWTGRAARMLAEAPELADYSFATAVVLGDIAKVRRAVDADPGLATRPDPRTGWTALHAVSASRWHQLDPAKTHGMVAVAKLLIDRGADPNAAVDAAARAVGWTPLRCAVAGAANPEITRLLLSAGAIPSDNDLYLAGFADDDHQCLRMLLDHTTDVREVARMALVAPISNNDAEGVRLLLDAGADPSKYLTDDDQPCPVIYAAVRCDCTAEIVKLLLDHHAEPELPGADGRSPYALAISKGRTDLAELLHSHGATKDATDIDVFLSACLRADRADAERQLASQRGLLDSLTTAQQAAAMIRAAETGNAEAMRLMLDIGFPADVRGDDHDGTALHASAYSGSPTVARLLIEHGADVQARDRRWDSTPIEWAAVGSGEQHTDNPSPDWPGTIVALVDAGASVDGITIGPDDPKPPSPAVALLLRQYGVHGQ
jgi:ankyrin repeat protein